MSEAAAGRVGSVLNGKWQIDARIGSGGMATVYSATHRNGHRAAIKVLHSQYAREPSIRARFLREGYVANSVSHPGVVTVIDDGTLDDGSAYLVLELLEGENLDARRLRFGGRLPPEEVLDYAEQALDALAAAHEKGIVHRDVKPENVFLTNEGKIKLLDFGLARMKDANLAGEGTKTGVTLGTPEFMPPEQAMGRKDQVDARTDVWAVGATMFTSITGRYVHEDAKSVHEQLIATATRRAPSIRQYAMHLNVKVAQVVDRALELEPADRWQSALEMRDALRAARGHSPRKFAAKSRPPSYDDEEDEEDDGPDDKTIDYIDPKKLPPKRPRQESEEDMKQTLFKEESSRRRAPPPPPPPAIATPTTNFTPKPSQPPPAQGSSRARKQTSSGRPVKVDTDDADGATMMAPGARAILEPEEGATINAPLQVPTFDDQTLGMQPATRAYQASTPPPPPSYPQHHGHAQMMSHHHHHPQSWSQPPMPMPMPLPAAQHQKNHMQTFVVVSIILIVVCAAMGAYVLGRGGSPALE